MQVSLGMGFKNRKRCVIPSMERLEGRDIPSIIMSPTAVVPYNEGGSGSGAVPFYNLAYFSDDDGEAVDYTAWDQEISPADAWIDWGDGGVQNYDNPYPVVDFLRPLFPTGIPSVQIDWGHAADVSQGSVSTGPDGAIDGLSVAGAHRYLASGDYTITIVAVDNQGNYAVATTQAHVDLTSDGGAPGGHIYQPPLIATTTQTNATFV